MRSFNSQAPSHARVALVKRWTGGAVIIMLTVGVLVSCSQNSVTPAARHATVSAPVHLQAQLRENPLAINSVHPHLGWMLPWHGHGQLQSAYQILAASSPQLLRKNNGNLWNSGKVVSNQSIGIRYEGSALTSRRRCFWKVRVWNQDGVPSRWSAMAEWQEGLLTPAAWHHAQWIGWKPATKRGVRHPLPAIYLRQQFNVTKPVRRAVAYFSGLGLGRMYFNGRRTSEAQLSPALSWYPKRCYYVARNVTTLLKPGKNAVGVILGNGRMYGMSGVCLYSFYLSPRMIFMLHITYTDGSTAIITSGKRWKMTDTGPIRMNNEYNGETYNALRSMPGWNQTGFQDTNWKAAIPVHSPARRLMAQCQYPIAVTQTLHPVKLAQVAPGKWIFDMGQNMAGWCRIVVPNGPAGTRIVLRHGDSLTRNGHYTVDLNPAKKGHLKLYVANLRTAKQTDTLILNGKGPITWHPIFTTHGFRFVELTGYPGTPALTMLEGQEVHDALPVTGGFECSDELVNRIFHNCRWDIMNNFRSIPTGCADRDEREGWLGNRSEQAMGVAFLFSSELFYKKWLWDIQDGQRPDGSISDVDPPYWKVYNNDVTWPITFIFLPGNIYRQYGGLAVIREHYAAQKKWMNLELGFVHHGISSMDTYGDWCPPPRSPHRILTTDPGRITPGSLLATVTLYQDLKEMAWYAHLLGKPVDQRFWLSEAHRLYAGFNKHLWNARGHYYANGSDTSAILPLDAGIVPTARRADVIRQLLYRIDVVQRGHVGGGIIGDQWLFHTLTQIGHTQVAWNMLNKTTYPGWGYMVRHGATTVWELWNSNTADPAMNSQDHPMLIDDLLSWFFEDIAGIQSDPRDPGFHYIVMRPRTPRGLTWVQAWHRSPYGKIVSNWKITPDHIFAWHVRIPPNSFASVEIPAAQATSVTLDGHAIINRPWIKFVAFVNGRAIYSLESGDYHFQSQMHDARTGNR
ncbi:MAG: family 78 glycoside hydrolase catalytic domain [Phycisphaerae bacterium]